MISTEIRVIKLSCVNCGSSLDISQQMNRLACGYCGTQQIVERSGGAIHLRGVAETLAKVQVGTDKTAAELAINRISKELEAAHYQRSRIEQNWLNVRTQKHYEWNAVLEARKNQVNLVTLISGIIATIPSGIIATVIYKILAAVIPNAEKAVLPVVIIFLIGCGCAAVFVRKWMHKSDKYNPEKLQTDRNRAFVHIDREIAKDLGEADQHIAALNAKIQQNYRIANS